VQDKRVLSSQIVILTGQVLELKVEVALLKGKLVAEAVEDAFHFLECSSLLRELFDDEHLRRLKDAYLKAYETSLAVLPPLTETLEEPPVHSLGETASELGTGTGVVFVAVEE
jgi:hypothetical protein